MGLLFIQNKSHRASDESGQYCKISRLKDAADCADTLYDSYQLADFNRDDWSIVRSVDLIRVLTRILKSDEIQVIRYSTDEELVDELRNSCKLKNQSVMFGDVDTTVISYNSKSYDVGYELDVNDLISQIKQDQLYDMSDALEICNELEIAINWSRLDFNVVDVKRVTSERRKLRK